MKVTVKGIGDAFDPGSAGVFEKNVSLNQLGPSKVISADAVLFQVAGTNGKIENGMNFYAQVSLVGPPGDKGVKNITVGFVQNLAVAVFEGTWVNSQNSAQTKTLAAYSTVSNKALEAAPNAAPLTYWDTQLRATDPSGAFYDDKPTALLTPAWKPNSKIIFSGDGPSAQYVVNLPGAFTLQDTNAKFDLTDYVAATTDESNSIYVPQALGTWKFLATGTIKNTVWISNGAGVIPPAQNVWTTATMTTPVPITTGVKFNTLVKKSTPTWGAVPR